MSDVCVLPNSFLENTSCPETHSLRCRDPRNRAFCETSKTRPFKPPAPLAAVSNRESSSPAQVKDQRTADLKPWWGKATNDLVQFSTFPFLFLSLPQVRRNAMNLLSGNVSALAILSWKGFLTALAANSILMTYFCKKHEHGAALVQAIGVASNFILLIQIYLAGLLNGGILWGVAALIALSAFINGTVVLGASQSWNGFNVEQLYRLWEMCLSVLGLSLLVHALWSTIFPQTTLLPACITAVVSLTVDVLHWRGALGVTLEKAWSGISAWTATLLFAFQPVGQLVCNFADPLSLSGISLNSILLGTTGNALMVPRALHTRDKIWLTGHTPLIRPRLTLGVLGTLWGSLMGWAQLLCLYIAGLQTGSCYLSVGLFYLLSCCLAIYFFFVFSMEARSTKLRHPIEALRQTYFSY